MKSVKLIGLALGASLALSTAALAQDLTVALPLHRQPKSTVKPPPLVDNRDASSLA